MTRPKNISEIKVCNRRYSKKTGREWWFDPGAMRFFNTKIQRGVYQGKGGTFFVTAERMDSNYPYRYSVREVKSNCAIDTRGPFNKIQTLQDAREIAKHLSKGRSYTGFGKR